MRWICEAESGRLRAGLRGTVPAVATFVIFLGGGLSLGAAVESVPGTGPVAAALLQLSGQAVLYVGLIAVAVAGTAKLERRDAAAFGLTVDANWLKQFAAGTAFTVLGVSVSLWWGELRGFREVDLSAVAIHGPGGPSAAVVVFGLFVGSFLLGNVYEEVVYRRIAIRNFAEGLAARGYSTAWAVVPATLASLVLFGLYHVPLRGNVVVAVDAALVGVTFALAYLLTGELALPIGVHFGRVLVEFLTGLTIGGFEVTAAVALTATTLPANLEVKLVRLGAICLFVTAWVYLTRGRLRLAAFDSPPIEGESGRD